MKFFCFTLLLGALSLSANVAAQQRVSVATGEWAPYTSQHLDKHGIGLHVISAAFEKVGVDVEYLWYPWARAMREAELRSAEFSGIWFRNAEREAKFLYTDPVMSSANVFFHRKDFDFDWKGYDNFPQDVTVGATINYSYSRAFDEAVAAGKIKVERTRNDELNFRKLLRGRVQAFVIGELAGYDLLNKAFSPEEIEQLSVHPLKISDSPLHMVMSKDYPNGEALVKKFNRGIKLLRQSGEFDAIMEEYK